MKNLCLFSISVLILFNACKKDSFITSPDARVILSADAIKFDTVFVNSGSVSQVFKIINQNDQKLRISSVKLGGGINSYFNMNVDGFSGPVVSSIEINANDSIYVFVSVNIDPSAASLPFVVEDSIQVNYNGATRQVKLEAWGRNAHFFRNKRITADETWNNDRPYVILGSLIVEANRKLTINKGCRIFVHADAPVIVDGTLHVNGSADSADRVQFHGDRLDAPYKDFPAGWPGIFFSSSSRDNLLSYAVLRNAYQALALQDPAPNANPKLTLNECIIDNVYDAGIIAINSSIRARNCLITNCGSNIILVKGGNYEFTHCTAASITNSYIFHRNPVLLVSNYILVNNNPVTADLSALFRNCIFWGDNGTVEDEVVVAKNGNTLFNVNFDYNLWKVKTAPSNITSNQIININPLFDSINNGKRIYNFRLKGSSPALNKGTNTSVSTDLDGKPRPIGLPDLGCYEKQ